MWLKLLILFLTRRNDMMARTNHLLQNPQLGTGPGRVAPPLHIPAVPPIGNTANISTAANTAFGRNNYRRVSMPVHQYMPNTNGSTVGYNGSFNNFPYRPYININGYNPYGQPTANQYQNP